MSDVTFQHNLHVLISPEGATSHNKSWRRINKNVVFCLLAPLTPPGNGRPSIRCIFWESVEEAGVKGLGRDEGAQGSCCGYRACSHIRRPRSRRRLTANTGMMYLQRGAGGEDGAEVKLPSADTSTSLAHLLLAQAHLLLVS